MKNYFGLPLILCGVALILLSQTPQAHYHNYQGVLLPDPKATPGAIRTTDTKAVCSGGSTKQFRHTTTAMKKKVCLSYGLTDCPHEGKVELDHLVSLELGGADSLTNLWPQPAEPKPGFHEKDELENWLHQQVCSGKMKLTDAQQTISRNWYQEYLEMKKVKRRNHWNGLNTVPLSP